MEKLLKTLDKSLPSWVDDLFPDMEVKDDKHLMSHFIKPAEDRLGLNRFQLHHFEDASPSPSASSASSSSQQHSSVVGKRKRGNNSAVPTTRKKGRKTVNSAATASALDDVTPEQDSFASSQDDVPHRYTVLNDLLGGNCLTMYDFVEKVPKGTDILLLLPGAEKDDKDEKMKGGGGHYDAKLQSLLQASTQKVPVVTRVGDDGATQPWFVFQGTFVKVERMNGIFHGVTLARNPPTIVVEVNVGGPSQAVQRPSLTLNMLKGVNDFLLWSPRLHADFESAISQSFWKKIIAPHGHGQNNGDRNRLLASLLQLVQHDPIRTAQVCQAARQVQEKMASKKLSNAMRSLDTKAAAKLKHAAQQQEQVQAETVASSDSSKDEQPRKRGARKNTTSTAASSKANQPKSSKKKAPTKSAKQTKKKKVAPSKAAAAAKTKPTKKKSSTTTTRGKKAAPTEATDDHMEDTTTTATSTTSMSSPARMSSPAEVSLLASSGMQFLLDAADMADSLDEEQQENSSEEHATPSEEYASSSFEAQAGRYSPNEVQEPARAGQQGVEQEEMMSQGGKMQDPLGFLCSVVAAKPTGAAADAHHVVAADHSTSGIIPTS